MSAAPVCFTFLFLILLKCVGLVTWTVARRERRHQNPDMAELHHRKSPTNVALVRCRRENCRAENPSFANYCRRCGASMAVNAFDRVDSTAGHA